MYRYSTQQGERAELMCAKNHAHRIAPHASSYMLMFCHGSTLSRVMRPSRSVTSLGGPPYIFIKTEASRVFRQPSSSRRARIRRPMRIGTGVSDCWLLGSTNMTRGVSQRVRWARMRFSTSFMNSEGVTSSASQSLNKSRTLGLFFPSSISER